MGRWHFVYLHGGRRQSQCRFDTSDVNVSKESSGKITAAELNKKIFAFREAVKNPNVDPRPLGKELYDVLVKPFEAQLDASKTKTILWSLDAN